MVRLRSPAPVLKYGGIPERPKGADCKSVVTDFAGPNPASPTKQKDESLRHVFLFVGRMLRIRGSRLRSKRAGSHLHRRATPAREAAARCKNLREIFSRIPSFPKPVLAARLLSRTLPHISGYVTNLHALSFSRPTGTPKTRLRSFRGTPRRQPSAQVASIACFPLWLKICHRHIFLTRRAHPEGAFDYCPQLNL